MRIRISRWKHKTKLLHALGFLQGIAEILDGVVTLLSLGFYMSNFEMEISRLRAKLVMTINRHIS